MADDDDKPKQHTLDTLFFVYCNYNVIPMELDGEMHASILLSQIDCWLDQAKLLRTRFTTTQTGLIYMKYKKWRLDYEDFLEFLQQLCAEQHINVDFVKQQMLEAGPPVGAELVIVK